MQILIIQLTHTLYLEECSVSYIAVRTMIILSHNQHSKGVSKFVQNIHNAIN